MPIENATARILGGDGSVVGAGVVFPGNRVATAAHCVNVALDHARLDAASKVGASLRVDFPVSSRKPFDGTVVAWRSPADHDVCVLQLGALPQEVTVPRFDASAQWRFDTGAVARGVPRGSIQETRIRLRGNVSKNIYNFYVDDDAEVTVEPGYSGGPVYLLDDPSPVVGIVLSYSEDRKTGRFSRIADVLQLAAVTSLPEDDPRRPLLEELEWFVRDASWGLLEDLERNCRDGVPDEVCDGIRGYLTALATAFERVEEQFVNAESEPLIVDSKLDRPSKGLHQFRDRYAKWNNAPTREAREEEWQTLRRNRRKVFLSQKKLAAALVTGEESRDSIVGARDRLRGLIDQYGDTHLSSLRDLM